MTTYREDAPDTPLGYTDRAVSPASPLPVTVVGGVGGGPVDWADVENKPTTFPPEVGTTATTAKAGNYAPAWGDVTGKPATFAPVIGATATTAAAGNHVHAIADITGLEARLAALEARIDTLEGTP